MRQFGVPGIEGDAEGQQFRTGLRDQHGELVACEREGQLQRLPRIDAQRLPADQGVADLDADRAAPVVALDDRNVASRCPECHPHRSVATAFTQDQGTFGDGRGVVVGNRRQVAVHAPQASDQTANSLPLGSVKWKRRPPGNSNTGLTTLPPAASTFAWVSSSRAL